MNEHENAQATTITALLQQLIMCASNRTQSLSIAAFDDDCDEEKETDPQVLLDTEVNGIRCLLLRSTSPITDQLNQPTQLNQPNSPHALDSDLRRLLSPREQEIARMIAKGYPNKMIATVLEISPWTVGTHLRRIFAKLNVPSRAAMVARVMDAGLLS